MTREWQIKVGGAVLSYAGDLGIESIDLSFVSLATDTATLRCDPSLSLAYGTMVGIYYAGVRRFLGRVTRPSLAATGSEHYRTIRLAGPWEWLERIPYRQSWRIWNDEALGTVLQSRVILNQDADGAPVNVETQLADIVAHAASRTAPLAFGSAAVGLTLPWDEQRDIRCSQAIARCLRFAPSVCSRIDYSRETPAIHFGPGAAISLPASAESIVTGYRDDLVVPGVTIEIERIATRSVDGQSSSVRSLQYLAAGDTGAVDALYATLQLAGPDSSRTSLRVDVQTEDIPEPLENAAWWIARHPRLQGIAAPDIVFIQVQRHLAAGNAPVAIEDAAAHPRLSLNPLADLPPLSVSARAEVFRAVVDLIKRDDAGEIVDAEHAVELELQVIATNARTKEYRVPQSWSSTSGEPVPANLAAELLAQFSVRYAEGSARFPARHLWPAPGDNLDGTPVQTVSVSSADKCAEIIFGPPQHLSVADFASLLQGFRTRRASVSWQARTDGAPPADAEAAGGQSGIARAGGHAPGAKTQLTIKAPDGAGGAIQLRPSQIDTSETIRVRQISWKDPSDTIRTAKVLATDHIPQDGTEPPPPEDDYPSPPCGHPGNLPGGGSASDDGDYTDHPGDDPPSEESGNISDHPGDSPSPPCASET